MSERELLVKLPWVNIRAFDAILSSLTEELSVGNRPVFVVKGSSGSGKTRIMLEAAKKIIDNKDTWIACTSAHADSSEFEKIVYKALHETHRLTHLEFQNRLELLLKQRSLHSDRIVLFIDDAHLLTIDHLVALYELSQNESVLFQIVFFVDKQYNIDILKDMTTYQIPPITISETEKLINQLASYFGKEYKLSQQALNELHNMAYGHPGRIINELLRGDLNKHYRQRRYYIAGFLVSILLLLLLVCVNYFKGEPKTTIDTAVIDDDLKAIGLPDFVANITMGELLTSYEKIMKINTGAPSPSLGNSNQYALEGNKEESDSPSLLQDGKEISVKQLVVNRAEDHSIVNKNLSEDLGNSKKMASKYYIRLVKSPTKSATERVLSGRTIPGSLNVVQQGDEWVAILGPYQTEAQAEEGIKKLPHSLQVLLPIVIER